VEIIKTVVPVQQIQAVAVAVVEEVVEQVVLVAVVLLLFVTQIHLMLHQQRLVHRL
jgi:hypothetical protein